MLFRSVLVDTLDGMTASDYGHELINSWGIGRKDESDGILLLLAVNDGEIQISVGFGLEDILDSRVRNQALDDAMPALINGDFSEGFRVAFRSICLYAKQAISDSQTDLSSDGV